eukprot:scaffold47370_cov60-Phaeocystis_antarctica.AAC.4
MLGTPSWHAAQKLTEGDGPTVGAAKGAGAVGATPLSAAPDLTVTSCSATDWPAELDGGPGGSDAVGTFARDMDRLAGSESGSDTEPSDWVCTVIWVCTVHVGTVSRDLEVGTVPREATVAQHEKHDSSDEEHAEGEQCPQPGRGWRRGQTWRRRWRRRGGEPRDLDLDVND